MDERTYEQSLFAPPEGEPRADPAPRLIGNIGVKELLLAAVCYFTPHQPKTAVPMIVIARSGAGKTTLLEASKETFGSDVDVYGVDALTPAQSKGTIKGGKLVRVEYAPISLFDEINKWQINYIEGVLIPVFGAEQGVRVREGTKFDTSKYLTLPIGTLLPYWKDFESKSSATSAKKTHNIEQMMRRSTLYQLDEDLGDDDEFLDDYIDMVLAEHFENIHYKSEINSQENYEKLIWVIDQAHHLPPTKFDTAYTKEAKKTLRELAKRIVISERVVYNKTFVKNGVKLAIGLARRYGRHYVTLDDVSMVCQILKQNAKALGFYYERCENCNSLIPPDDLLCARCSKQAKKASKPL